jgi:hypothetical protein
MKPTTRTFLALTLLAAGSGAVSAQQTLTFTNTDTDSNVAGQQPLSLNLIGGSSLSIAPNGNISAQCVLAAPPSTLCAGVGGSANAPVVSLAATGFSQSPDGTGQYPTGTTFTLTPTVTGAEVCVRSATINGAASTSTGWTGTVAAPVAAQTVTLTPTASASYVFSLRCYGAGGATTFSLAPIATSAIIDNTSCGGFVSPLPSGWVRGSQVRFDQVQAVEADQTFWNNFPNSGFTGYLTTDSNQYISLAFTAPTNVADWTAAAPFLRFDWGIGQQGGEAVLSKVYVSISSCVGDFRIPPVGQVAPANDPTFARGCRNIRPAFGFPTQISQTIPYLISTVSTPSDDTTCRLTPGVPYHLNVIRANALDGTIGLPADEATCQDGSSGPCGIQMRVH